jgi:hypothetical protein
MDRLIEEVEEDGGEDDDDDYENNLVAIDEYWHKRVGKKSRKLIGIKS